MTISYDDRTRSRRQQEEEVTTLDVGNVTIKTAKQTITADRAQLDLRTDILTVTGNVRWCKAGRPSTATARGKSQDQDKRHDRRPGQGKLRAGRCRSLMASPSPDLNPIAR